MMPGWSGRRLTAAGAAAIFHDPRDDAGAVARDFGVTRTMVHHVRGGKAWGHVTGMDAVRAARWDDYSDHDSRAVVNGWKARASLVLAGDGWLSWIERDGERRCARMLASRDAAKRHAALAASYAKAPPKAKG